MATASRSVSRWESVFVPFNLDAEWMRFLGDATLWHCSTKFALYDLTKDDNEYGFIFWSGWAIHHCTVIHFLIMINALVEMLIYKCSIGFTTCSLRRTSLQRWIGISRQHILFHHFVQNRLHPGDHTLQLISLSGFLIRKHLHYGNNITYKNHFKIRFMHVHVQCSLVEIKIGKRNVISKDFLWKIS